MPVKFATVSELIDYDASTAIVAWPHSTIDAPRRLGDSHECVEYLRSHRDTFRQLDVLSGILGAMDARGRAWRWGWGVSGGSPRRPGMSESPRQQTHRPRMRELQVLDDGLDDVALAVDQQRELAAASGLRQSPRLRVAATGSSRPRLAFYTASASSGRSRV